MAQCSRGHDTHTLQDRLPALPTAPALPRILAIHHDPSVRQQLRRNLVDQGYAVETAASAIAAGERVRERQPALVILDATMPGIDGLDVLVRLGNTLVPLLLLTAEDAGAAAVPSSDACLCDDEGMRLAWELLGTRVRARVGRQPADNPLEHRFADLTVDAGAHATWRGQRAVSLTSMEFRLLHEFVLHPRQVLSKDELRARVWGDEVGGNLNVVEVYVKQLRQKLEAAGEPRLIHTIRGAGYVLREA